MNRPKCGRDAHRGEKNPAQCTGPIPAVRFGKGSPTLVSRGSVMRIGLRAGVFPISLGGERQRTRSAPSFYRLRCRKGLSTPYRNGQRFGGGSYRHQRTIESFLAMFHCSWHWILRYTVCGCNDIS